MMERDIVRLPQSRYSQELDRGPVSLRFPPLLEKEFRAIHLTTIRSRARIWQTSMLVSAVMALWAGIAMRGESWSDSGPLLRALLLIPTSLLMVYCAWSKSCYQIRYFRVALLGSLVVAAVSSWMVAQSIAHGRPEALVFLTVYVMGVFFLSGLLFFDACLVSLLTLLMFALAGAAHDMALTTLIYDTVVLVMVICVWAFTTYGIEQTSRQFFLERGVLGDLAERDGLTGLRNRRAFDEHVSRVWQQSLHDRSSMAMVMIDLDYFKNFNDAYGHQAGDACLRQVSQLVQQFARRPLDIAARYGGEELSMVLYQVTRDQAQLVAEQIRDSVEKLRIEHRAAAGRGVVTVSIGVSWTEVHIDRLPEQLLQAADEALYNAKMSGRNTVCYLGPDETRRRDSKVRLLPARH